jgi:hypothetical protein
MAVTAHTCQDQEEGRTRIIGGGRGCKMEFAFGCGRTETENKNRIHENTISLMYQNHENKVIKMISNKKSGRP